MLCLLGISAVEIAASPIAGEVTAIVAKSFPRCASTEMSGVPICTEQDGVPAYSGTFHVRGTGVIRSEWTQNTSGYFTSGGTQLEYLDPDTGQWGAPYYSQWAFGLSGYNWCRSGGTSDGSYGWQECKVTNANSHALRLAAGAPRYHQAIGFDQFDGPITLRLSFTPTESSLSERLDQAGGATDNPHTVFHPMVCGTEYGVPRHSVNTAHLNLVIEDTDFGWQSFGHALRLRRVWNMQPSQGGPFGNGWSFEYVSTLVAAPLGTGNASVTLGSGQRIVYTVSERTNDGQGTLSLGFTRATSGLGPVLNAQLDSATGIGEYRLTDQRTGETAIYTFAREDNGEHRYRLHQRLDRNGNAVTLGYDGAGRLISLADASGRTVTFSYDANDRCTRIDTFDGQSVQLAYDAADNLIETFDLAGTRIRYTYDEQGFPLSMQVGDRTTRFAYATNASGERHVSAVTDPNGEVTKHEAFYDGATTRVTDPGGGALTYTQDRGRTTAIRDALGTTIHTALNDQVLPATITDPLGATVNYEYDADGNLLRLTDREGGVTRFTYDADWNLTAAIDALDQRTDYAYDDRGNLTAQTTPLGHSTRYAYDALGQLTSITRPDGSRYRMEYDSHGNLAAITDPLDQRTLFSFDAHGLNLTQTTDPLGKRTGWRFDVNQRLLGITRADASELGFGYDCCALVSVTDGAGQTTRLQRDALDNLTAVIDPLGRQSQFGYSADGDLTAATDPLGRISRIGYDAARRAISLTNPMDGQIRLTRDALGNPTRLTDERDQATDLTYDPRGRLASVQDPLGQRTGTYTRDALGRISSVTNARGGVIGLDYDADGRLLRKRYDGGVVASYTWDAADRLTAVADASGSTGLTYDTAGRVTRITYPEGRQASFAYDAAGNPTRITYPDGLVVEYDYDALNRVSAVRFAGQRLDLSYDAADNLVRETRSNGVETLYGFDAAGQQLTRITHRKGTQTIADIHYNRDAGGAITSESGTYPLAPVLTPVSASASHNAANALLHWGGDSFTQDVDGNLTAITGTRSLSVGYDSENRLTALTRGTDTTQYAYDGLGNRIEARAGTLNRRFWHDAGGRVLADQEDFTQSGANYVYAGGRLIASGSAASGYLFHHFSQIGSTLALTDTQGQVVGRYAYDPFGKVVAREGVFTPMTFVGAWGVIEGSGDIFFMRHRYYDAQTGRFIQRDPIGFAGGQTNLYVYAGNSVVERIDPSGLAPFGWNIPYADATPGSTMDQFLRAIFRQQAATLNGKPAVTLVERVPGLFQRTFWSTPGPVPATNPLGCPPASSPSFGLTAARVYAVGYSAWAGWMLTGKLLQDIGRESGNEDLELFGTAMIGAAVDPEAWMYAGRYYLGVIERLLEGPAPVYNDIPADAAHHRDYRGVKIYH